MRHRTLLTVTAVLAAAGSLLLAGCGGDDDADTSTPTPAGTSAPATTAPASTAPEAASTVAVVLGRPVEFGITADPATVPAGPATFAVSNAGEILHEMVVVPAPDGVDGLTLDGGEADETGALGEVADLAPGDDGTLTVDLPAGDYVLLCNLPGHFAGGMYTALTVG
ncbi:hypothetical protein [Miltoncostaea oceani]|uniref:hypothetical protein n=1 Tax=Miltoncostaea oceani TaxID=2843216 RepID=UPI001C3D2C0E|nr:hypothetical protein [Miltoncostaea oceani]